MKYRSSHTNRHLIRLICILCGFLLYGCAAPGNSPIRTLRVKSPSTGFATVYLDSTYIGVTPLTMSVNQDSVDGAQLRVIYQGEVVLNEKLKKDSRQKEEYQATALGVGAVVSGALMLAMPFPWAFIAPAVTISTSSIIAYSATPDSLKNDWTYIPASPTRERIQAKKLSAIAKSDSSEKTNEDGLALGRMHGIQKTLFWLDKKFDKTKINLKASTYLVAGNDLVLSSGVCYDKNNKTIWLRSDLPSGIIYPVSLDEMVNKCISLEPSQKLERKSFWKPVLIATGVGAGIGALVGGDEPGMGAVALGGAGFFYGSLVGFMARERYTVDGEDMGVCPQAPPEKEELEKWFLQYPCGEVKPAF